MSLPIVNENTGRNQALRMLQTIGNVARPYVGPAVMIIFKDDHDEPHIEAMAHLHQTKGHVRFIHN